jgi:NADH-quinone oxidoreductase subunit H
MAELWYDTWHSEFWQTIAGRGITILAEVLVVIVVLLIFVAYVTYFERKVLALAQLRRGPNVVGPFGLMQPFADGLKLMTKETIIPAGANRVLFIMAPMLTFTLALIGWAVVPFYDGGAVANINVGILYLFAISSLGVYGIIIAGWASNSKYSFLGALRSAAQMVSYEVSIGFVIVSVLLTVGSLNLTAVVTTHQPWWQWLLLSPMLVVFFISGLAETNRPPFDLPEGESELVGGFNTEYSAMTFALFMLGEYANMFMICALTTMLFLGGWLPPFGWHIAFLEWGPLPALLFIIKMWAVMFLFLWVRATLPRFRYDQLMRLGWKIFLPFSLAWLMVIGGVLLLTNTLPNPQ